METHYVDVHCHPSLKPYSKSFKFTPPKQNMSNAGRKNSIWHYSPPNFLERTINRVLTLTKFTQTDMTALAKARTKVVIVSLYPFEKHFLTKNILGVKGITDLLVNLATSISQSRMDYVRNHDDYFRELEDEYEFYKQLNKTGQRIDGKTYQYRLAGSFQEIQANMAEETEFNKIISIITSIEGGHCFNTGLKMDQDTAIPSEVLENVRKVKKWKHRPLFITFAHHFYNELCGHARSISIKAIMDNQNRNLNSGITALGHDVIKLLLDNSEGTRIPLDIKHMSTTARKAYYSLLDTTYALEKIPVIASHGACNGKRSIVQWDSSDYPNRALLFSDIDINFYDDEIIRMRKSDGLFGIQLDERRIGSKKAIKKSKIFFPNKRKQMRKKSLLVWQQVKHIAEVLDTNGLSCWDLQAIGSDFDGVVNPIKGLWTAENMRDLGRELKVYVERYMRKNRDNLQPFNRIPADQIVEQVLHGNAMKFIERNY